MLKSHNDVHIETAETRSGSISHIFRADPTNCGDWWSLPAHYFTFPNHDSVIDINDYEPGMDFNRIAIIGGGGLIGPAFRQLEDLIERNDVICIGWGLGNNMTDDKRTGYVAHGAPLPEYATRFNLLGIRDVVEGLRWVPCASCMHPSFRHDYPVIHDIVVFEHKRIPLNIGPFPRMSNAGSDIERVIRFLASGDTIITNSYHGAYWAALLNRKCVAIPFSSKFYGFKHPPALTTIDGWKGAIRRATAYSEALQSCRAANISFYSDVSELVFHNT
ncbi:conserved hypothetical protein [Thioalkalivibrio sulfidiphilus HL-EbGr7]|uniref:Polysaccharide pyruvyl transferase domain-containing protein n=1 Tax=Thioalkalivibrio sulfidiphilus (strain HL-EbGR7) TaxID=396588 RepID=B8GL53_THISH|nr:conserved hypothetical protein [Thioalkalivibrio sulfidiphilus HL-EbGr7]